MRYALLIYNPDDGAEQKLRAMDPSVEAFLVRPDVAGWIRLHAAGSATTVRHQEGQMLLTDGPFVDSKEFLGGLIVLEAANLDGALAAAAELQQLRPGRVVAVEVRPIRDAELSGA